jgi:hypothetical protein
VPNLERMHDFDAEVTDQIWKNAGRVHVSVLAKYSMLTHTFGFLGGDGKTFTSLFEVRGSGRSFVHDSTFDVSASGDSFRFSNAPAGDRMASSRMAENAFGLDQMVTWRVANATDETYVIAFEDRPGRLAIADYNDLIIEVKLGAIGDGEDPDAEPVPEPATLILLGLGAAGLAASRRAKR